MNRSVLFILSLFVSISVMAVDERLRQINAIKMNVDYLYGEATMASQEDAASLAYEKLQKEVLAWTERDSITLVIKSVAEINQLSDTIMTRRAEMYRVFAYVKKVDLVGKTDSVQAPTVPEPKDSLITDGVKRTIMQRFFGNKKKDDALLRLKNAKTFFELREIMQPLKEKGEILDYGKYATAVHPELCYLIVYDPAGNIIALLGKGKDTRKNLKTGQDDSITNYRGCGAIWFTLDEKSK